MDRNRLMKALEKVKRLNEKLSRMSGEGQTADDWVGAHRFTKDPEYLLVGNPTHPEHDDKGFRNDAAPGRTAILAIGDSMTYGHKVKAKKSWPAQLRQITGRPVYNAGINGWGAVQYAMTLERLLTLAPQTVLVNLYLGNDIYESFSCAKASTARFARSCWDEAYEDIPFPDFTPHFKSMAEVERRRQEDGLSEEAALESMRGQGWADVNHVRIGDSAFYCADTLHRISEDADHPLIQAGLEVFEKSLVRMRDLVRNYGSTLHLLIQPTKEYLVWRRLDEAEVEDPESLERLGEVEERLMQRVKDICRDNFVKYSDMSRVLAQYLGKRTYTENHYDGHYTERGHKLVASHIADVILPRVDKANESDIYPIF